MILVSKWVLGLLILFISGCAYEQSAIVRTSDSTVYKFQRVDVRGEIGDPAWTALIVNECETKKNNEKCRIVRIDTTTTPSKWQSSLGGALIGAGLIGGGIGAGTGLKEIKITR
jgi:hypothetical protein